MRWHVTNLARRIILAIAAMGSCLYLILLYRLVFTDFATESYWDVRGIGGVAPIALLLPLSFAWVFLLERLYPRAAATSESTHAQKFRALVSEVHKALYGVRESLGFVDLSLEDGDEPHALRLASLLVAGASDGEIANYLSGMCGAAGDKALPDESIAPAARRICALREVARAIGL